MSSSEAWPALAEIVSAVNRREVSVRDNVERALKQADAVVSYQSLIETLDESALARADELDERIEYGEDVGRLAGVPFIVKDNFLTVVGHTTAASNMLRGFRAPYNATAVARLEAEGAICVGKANLDAFAHGSSTENSDWFTTKNPHDESRVPGGSSGGSAAAVALKIAPFALGTDTGGSIRLPAAFCGVVGLKPTYGVVSRSGVVAMGSSTDVIGPLAQSAADAALVLDCMAGRDEWDGTTIERDEQPYSELSDYSLKGKKVGIIKEYMSDDLDPAIRDATQTMVDKLTALGAEVEEVSLPSLPLSLACYYIIVPAEISSNLARYDGQHYGHVSQGATTLDEVYTRTRSEGFGKENKRRIMVGTYVLSSGFYDAYYRQAQLVRAKLIKEFEGAFSSYDFLVGPTAASTAFAIGDNASDPLAMYLTDVMTVAANLVGIPAISIPAGEAAGLPIGFQLFAAQRADRALLAASHHLEEVNA